ncbi:MAG: threonylcarbamoyl-AMP synthase [Candidatus Levybacteria bacterium RIFCSPHIGHO2_01_FULL_37_33]|nr:MAG: threonylcarbamoyl-AMP synthase [Candidatus Levybacteria bacterium RIFCSPHIGHO2_01_FULL_37_33]OGH17599.1 MAG: threonylcarbamoyl-AMP synthase [Candidatus Levybacteria bacterium RIFCSPHIGHO2_02_FULL_37_11]OGH29047.1 MAG: threonylcarbamoyl-AMP synthase [Candidatus Levybacteria bacterium RIFCSPHIGHO2_12_FULL_37_12]OGH33143.1 MAG: threonylcarbamoyl-AMP synthase [Candidatus Levybacteria bacterium RIFCSPLOWO2_01_FULL_36_54]
MKSDIDQAVRVLNKGGIVIFPTDTAFGMGCRMDNEKAIRRLFTIRKRPKDKPVPVLVSSFKMVEEYLEPTGSDVRSIMEKHWPGGLTLILCCNRVRVPSLVRAGKGTIGVRIPNHKTALKLIKGVGVPILGPSANFHGEKTPYSLEDLNPDLVKLVDFAISGKTNNIGSPSTVVDCSVKPWTIIRKGAVKLDLRIKNYEL